LRIETEVDSSDSEDEEVPDWAEDIMADLAIIADGKMPSSLLQSQEVLEAEAKLGNSVFDRLTNPQSFTGVQKHAKPTRSTRKIDASENSQGSDEKEKKAEKPTKKSKEKAPKNTESTKRNVFDRLLSPSNLTGTQKQRFNRIQDKKGRDLEKAIENQHVSVRGRPHLKENPSDETEDEGWTAQNDDEFSLQRRDSELSENRNEMHSPNKKDEYSKLDVFERLNKKTTQAYKEKRHSNIAEKMLDDCLAEEEASQGSAKFEPRLERVKEYESRNVFERLQKTTTESYAKKKNTADTLLDDLLSDDDMGDVENDTKFEPSSERVKEYERRNVFERLQRTTTESYAKKKNNDVLDELLADEDTENEESAKFEPSSERVKEYESRNVFERLQRTTTESYAKKKNNSMEEAHRYGSPVRKNSDWSISSPKNAARRR